MTRPAAITHTTLLGCSLDQKPNGVLVTYPSGATRLVLNASLKTDPAQQILLAAARPVVVSRITPETSRAWA